MSTTTYGSVVIDSSFQQSLDSDHVLAPQAQRIFKICRSIVTIGFLLGLLFGALLVVMTTERKSALEDLQDLAVLFRHGERQPLIPMPSLGYDQPGDLTAIGSDQMIKLGTRTKRQYRAFFNDVKHSRIVAANESRSKKSAELFMQALETPSYDTIYIPYMVVNPADPSYAVFVEREKVFRTHVSDCMKQVATTIIEKLNISLPENFQLLYGILIADSLDMVRDRGLALPFDLDKLECVQNEKVFLTPQLYKALTDLAMATFARSAIQRFVDEIRILRKNAATSSLLGFSLSDVHISGLLSVINPEKAHPGRPGFGAHLIFHFFQNDVEVLYAPSFDSVAEVWNTREVLESFLQRIEQAIR